MVVAASAYPVAAPITARAINGSEKQLRKSSSASEHPSVTDRRTDRSGSERNGGGAKEDGWGELLIMNSGVFCIKGEEVELDNYTNKFI